MSELLKRGKERTGLGQIKQRVEIDILRPTDHKGFTVRVDKETATGFQTRAYEQDKYMIWKNGPGFSMKGFDKYFAIEGDLLTSFITEEDEPMVLSVPEFLKRMWPDGETLYANLPDELKEPLEHEKWAATITVKPGKIAPAAESVLSEVKAQEILKDASLEIANEAARAKEKKDKLAQFVGQIYLIGFGFFLCYFVSNAMELF